MYEKVTVTDAPAAINRRSHANLKRGYVRLAHLEGMVRIIAQLRKEGAV